MDRDAANPTSQRRPICLEGLVPASLPQQCLAEQEMPKTIVRLEGDTAAELCDRLLPLRSLQIREPQAAERPGMIGGDFLHRPILLHRFIPALLRGQDLGEAVMRVSVLR